MTDNPAAAAQMLLDRIEIEKLAFLYGRGNDVAARYFDECMTDDVEVIYPFGQWTGLEEHKRQRDATIGVAFTFTQHLLTNPFIDISGDTAKATYYVFAAHGLKTPGAGGKSIIYAGAIYNHDLVRTAKGWRIKRHHCETLWIDDDGGMQRQLDALVEAV